MLCKNRQAAQTTFCTLAAGAYPQFEATLVTAYKNANGIIMGAQPAVSRSHASITLQVCMACCYCPLLQELLCLHGMSSLPSASGTLSCLHGMLPLPSASRTFSCLHGMSLLPHGETQQLATPALIQ